MTLSPDAAPGCGALPQRVYNPVACRLTEKKHAPLNVSRFLQENQKAVEFWELVDSARAYENHHVDRDRHYRAYVDTWRLITSAQSGPTLLLRYLERLRSKSPEPEVLIVRNRRAAVHFATTIRDSLMSGPGGILSIVIARSERGRLAVSQADQAMLRDRSVLIVDTAAAHGDTIDELSLLCRRAGAVKVGAGVILSRMGESHEVALTQRLSGGFFALYAVPIPHIEVYHRKDSCPVCAEASTLQRAAMRSSLSALVELALRAQQKKKRARTAITAEQQTLHFDERPLLQRCRRGVAAGITLHALHATMGNGMAPISVPEICDVETPVANRTAMLDALPGAALKAWGAEPLVIELSRVLASVDHPQVWIAVASFLARSGSPNWIDDIEGAAHRWQLGGTAENEFWNRLTLTAFRAVESKPLVGKPLCDRLEQIRAGSESPKIKAGIGTMLRAIEVAAPDSV